MGHKIGHEKWVAQTIYVSYMNELCTSTVRAKTKNKTYFYRDQPFYSRFESLLTYSLRFSLPSTNYYYVHHEFVQFQQVVGIYHNKYQYDTNFYLHYSIYKAEKLKWLSENNIAAQHTITTFTDYQV